MAGQHSDHSPDDGSSTSTSPRLQGAALVVARFLWLALVGTISFSFLTAASQYVASASKVCTDSCLFTPATEQALSELGIPFSTFLWATLILALVIFLAALIMSIVLFLRRSYDWMALLISCYIVIYPLNNIVGSVAASSSHDPLWYNLVSVVFSALGIAPFLLFPSGRFIPRWSWMVLVGWLVFWIAFNILNVDFPVGYLIVYASLIGCQIYRYRSVSTPVERQQTKWVLLGFVASLLANQVYWTQFYLPPLMPLATTLYGPLSYLVFEAALLFVPVTFFIAIQRYRLFDIDVIINRALVYGSLTGLLAAIYAGSVLGLQAVFRGLTNQGSPVALVISTLLIAALFTPLRRWVQRLIDRRFYRERYDAATVVSRFEETLHTEVELDQLTRNLIEVVYTTMHPEYVSLWLRETELRTDAGGQEPRNTST
jgi:hypothetical protein